MIHWHRKPNCPCGVKCHSGLPRTSVLREVTCDECRKSVCEPCQGTGYDLDRPTQRVRPPFNPPFHPCANCRGSGLNLW